MAEAKICSFLRAKADYLSDCICIEEKSMWWDPADKNCGINILTDYIKKLIKEKS